MQEILQVEDTIVAQVTSGGTSGVSIVRLSGQNSFSLAASLLKGGLKSLPGPGRFALRQLRVSGKHLDNALFLTFLNPRSLTGEDVIEIHVHGNPFLVKTVISALIDKGARHAHPGEFLQRAHKNGKYTLNQVEAINQTIMATSQNALDLHSPECQTKLEKELLNLREKIIEVWSKAEAFFDFSDEEDVGENLNLSYQSDLALLATLFTKLKKIASLSEALEQTNEVCLIGPPNAGKSSLLNLLTEQDLAIVSKTAGTTRDFVSGQIFLGGYAVKVTDTAGLRHTSCDIEKEGIKRSWKKAKRAQCVIYLDAASNYPHVRSADLETINSLNCPVIRVVNKIDLQKNALVKATETAFHQEVRISVLERKGIDKLESVIVETLGLNHLESLPFAFNARQAQLLMRASKAFDQALLHLNPIELSVTYLRQASDILGEILGDCTSDDVLGKIFSQFCIGK